MKGLVLFLAKGPCEQIRCLLFHALLWEELCLQVRKMKQMLFSCLHLICQLGYLKYFSSVNSAFLGAKSEKYVEAAMRCSYMESGHTDF